jgi:uncharacterized protein
MYFFSSEDVIIRHNRCIINPCWGFMMFKVDVSDVLKDVGLIKHLRERITVLDPDHSFSLKKPVTIDLDIINIGDGVMLKGDAEAIVELNCSRCGKKFAYRLHLDIEEIFKKEEAVINFSEEDLELGIEDLYFVIEVDETIDIEEVLRQNIILSLPIQPLCSINCKPVQLTVGEINTGKAFAGLKNLLEKGKKHGPA